MNVAAHRTLAGALVAIALLVAAIGLALAFRQPIGELCQKPDQRASPAMVWGAFYWTPPTIPGLRTCLEALTK